MSVKAYFVVQPFEENEDGQLVPAQPIQAKDAAQARGLAQRLNCAGVIVFTRACDPDLGEYQDAVILLRLGRTPEDLHELMAA